MSSVEFVQSLFAAFGRGDIAYILAHTAPDCRWVSTGEGIPYSGEYIGPDGVAQFFGKMSAAETMLRFEAREYFAGADGTSVVALGFEEARVNATGKVAATNWAMVFRTSGGMLTYFEGFHDTAAYARAHAA